MVKRSAISKILKLCSAFLFSFSLLVSYLSPFFPPLEAKASGPVEIISNLEELKPKEISPSIYAFKTLDDSVIEIGTEKHSPPQPYLKLEKWDGEVSLKVNIPFETGEKPSQDGDKLRYSTNEEKPKIDIEFYPREPEEIKEIDSQGNEHTFTINEQGGVEFDTILYEKPEANKIIFPIEIKGLKFYYQPALTQEEIAEGAFRPENVVGSYAVYHSGNPINYVGGKEYKAGKAFHIYRPKIKDASGKEIWGELNINEQNNTLTITIDQNWLNNAVYPVTVDPTFGYTTAGGSQTSNYRSYLGSVFTGALGEITKISASMIDLSGFSNGAHRRAALYKHDDLSIVASSTTRTGDGTFTKRWLDFIFDSEQIQNTEYILCIVVYNGGSGMAPSLYYDAGDTNQGHSAAYPGPDADPLVIADTFPTITHSTNKYSIYVTYTAAGQVDTSTSASATAYSFQRKTWYDGSRFWTAFHSDADNRIEFWYSTDGTSWIENSSARISVDTNDFTIEADSSDLFIAYTDGYDIKANEDTGTYPATDFAWGASPTTVYDGSSTTDEYDYPAITKDSNNKVWITARHYTSSSSSGGANYPTSATTQAVSPEDDFNWTNPSNIGADDGNNAEIDLAVNTYSYRLKGQTFGFSVPSGASIDGILVEIERDVLSSDPYVYDYRVQLLDASGNLVGDNKADTETQWPDPVTIKSYGGVTDNWNATPTSSMVNDTDFGVVLSVQDPVANYGYGKVDFIRVTVYYTETTSMFKARQATTANDISAWGTASTLDTSTNSNKYGTIASLGSGNMYAIWIDGTTIEGKKYGIVDFAASANDGHIYGNTSYDWTDTRNTSAGYDTSGTMALTGYFFGSFPSPYLWRTYLKFDTSTIGSGSTVTQVNLKLTATADDSTVDFDVQIVKQDWSAQDPISAANREVAYDNCLTATLDDNIWRNTNGMSINTQYASGNLATAWINKTGNTYYSLINSKDRDNTLASGTVGNITIATQEHATVAYRPLLHIEYWGSATTIATGGTGLTNNMSAVADSSGNVHLLYINSSDYAVYQKYTTSWQTAVTLDSTAGNDYATISLNTSNNDLYALWIRSNVIYYKKGVSPYASANWDASATSWKSTGTNTYPTSNYSGSNKIFAEWTEGTTSPYSVNWDTVYLLTNQNPDSPTSLAQKKTNDTTIPTGGWTSETSVKLEGYINDPDASDQVKLQVEVQPLGTGFTGTPSGTSTSYCTDPCTNSVTIAGLTSGTQYHWQARSIDDDSATSSWVSYGGNAESERDFGVDTSAPTSVSVTSISENPDSAYQYVSGATTVYYNTASSSGSFIVNATATDSESGVQKINFPALTNFAPTNGGDDTSSPYSWTYNWTNTSTQNGSANITATNNAALTATAPFTVTRDITAPTGGSISYSDGYYTSLSVSLTVADGTDSGAGVDTSTRTVQRKSATLINGSCGSFGSWGTISPSGTYPNFTDTTVSSGFCYQYQYLVKDNVSNEATSSSGNTVKVDTSPPTVSISSIDESSSYAYVSGTTVYYNSASSGSFTVNVSASDSESGIEKVNFPETVSAGGDDPSSPYSMTYNWETSDTYSQSTNATAFNNAGLTNTAAFTVTRDITAPTGGSISYSDGYYTSLSVSLTVADGTDSGAGVDTSTRTVQRKSATLINGSCGSFGSWGTISPSGTYPNFTDTTVSSGFCYQYQYLVKDNVSNEATSSSGNTVKVDTSPPSVPGTPSTPTPTTDTTPSWSWAASTDAGSGLASTPYTVQWSTDSTFASGVSSSTSTTNSFTHPTALAYGTWYFRVRASDQAGNTSSWSETGSVSVTSPPPPEEEEAPPVIAPPEEKPPAVVVPPEEEKEKMVEQQFFDVVIKVTDQQGLPVEGARVELYSESRVAYTNSLGEARFSGVEKGFHRVLVFFRDQKGELGIRVGPRPGEVIAKTDTEKPQLITIQLEPIKPDLVINLKSIILALTLYLLGVLTVLLIILARRRFK